MTNTVSNMNAHATEQWPVTLVGLLVPMAFEIPLLLLAHLFPASVGRGDELPGVIVAVSAVIGFAFVARRLRVWQALLVAPIYFPVIGTLLGMIAIPFALFESP